MSIRTKIACTALGWVLLSGTAYGAEPTKPDQRHERDAQAKKTMKPGQPVDSATGAPSVSAAALQQLGCVVVGNPTAGPVALQLVNSTATALPAGTVVWIGPPGATGSDGVTSPSRGTNPDGTPAHMDRYFRLTSELAAGGSTGLNYSPVPTWPFCVAVAGMTSLISAVAFVE